MATVKELIEFLKTQNQDAEVMCEFDGGYGGEIFIWSYIEDGQEQIVLTPDTTGRGMTDDENYIWSTVD